METLFQEWKNSVLRSTARNFSMYQRVCFRGSTAFCLISVIMDRHSNWIPCVCDARIENFTLRLLSLRDMDVVISFCNSLTQRYPSSCVPPHISMNFLGSWCCLDS